MSIAAIPETYATAWTCLFRNIKITKGQSKGGTRDIDQLRPPAQEAAGARKVESVSRRRSTWTWASRRCARASLERRRFQKRDTKISASETSLTTGAWANRAARNATSGVTHAPEVCLTGRTVDRFSALRNRLSIGIRAKELRPASIRQRQWMIAERAANLQQCGRSRASIGTRAIWQD
jgi:hypothetical protein